MKKVVKYIMILMSAMFVASCVYPFTPEGVEEEVGLLVMEGDINSGIFSTFVPSRSIALTSESQTVQKVVLSDIYVESDGGEKFGSYEVIESSDNNFVNKVKLSYNVDTRGLDRNSKCRLVFSVEGKTYMTDWLDFTPTPPIDSVTYSVPEDKSRLDIYVHATGVNDSLRYFKWDYKEDWEFHSYFNQKIYYYPDSNQVYELTDDMVKNMYCWNSSVSTGINIFSTETLSENIVKDYLVRSIPNDDRRISYLYSIEVYQKALSQEAYKYWETLLKNNDGSAGIFAPQPNEMRGNIFCESDPNEMVLGYISSCAVEKKRIFIDRLDHRIYLSQDVCAQEAKPVELWRNSYSSGWEPVFADPLSGEVMWAPRKCVDCRVYGHKNKPSFWPNDHK